MSFIFFYTFFYSLTFCAHTLDVYHLSNFHTLQKQRDHLSYYPEIVLLLMMQTFNYLYGKKLYSQQTFKLQPAGLSSRGTNLTQKLSIKITIQQRKCMPYLLYNLQFILNKHPTIFENIIISIKFVSMLVNFINLLQLTWHASKQFIQPPCVRPVEVNNIMTIDIYLEEKPIRYWCVHKIYS